MHTIPAVSLEREGESYVSLGAHVIIGDFFRFVFFF